MGQRNATYIIIQHGTGKDSYKRIVPIYNQWNFIRIQAPKMVRGIKAVLKINWDNAIRYKQDIPLEIIYQSAAGLNLFKKEKTQTKVSQWVGGRIETDMFINGEYGGAFEEDNNNGWNIVKFIINTKTNKITPEIFCVIGSEDEEHSPDINNKTIEGYFCSKHDKITKSELKYLSQFKWNKSLKTEAENLLLELVEEGRAEREKQKLLIIEEYEKSIENIVKLI